MHLQNVLAYFGTLEETSGNAAVVTLRLKVADRKVAEAEWYLARKGDPGIGVGAGAQANAAFWDPEYLAAHPPMERVVPKADRVSREDLMAITNRPFRFAFGPRYGTRHDCAAGLRMPVLRIWSVDDATRCNTFSANTTPSTAGIFNGKTDCMNEGAMTNIFAVRLHAAFLSWMKRPADRTRVGRIFAQTGSCHAAQSVQ